MLNVSFRELILNSSILEKINPVEFPSVVIVLDEDLESKDVKINMMQRINIFNNAMDFGVVSVPCPICLLTLRLESRDEILI